MECVFVSEGFARWGWGCGRKENLYIPGEENFFPVVAISWNLPHKITASDDIVGICVGVYGRFRSTWIGCFRYILVVHISWTQLDSLITIRRPSVSLAQVPEDRGYCS